LVELYWQVGEHISRKLASAEWGDGVVPLLAAHIAEARPGLRGFTSRNLFRMRQFHETYRDAPQFVSALLTQIPWIHHLAILGQCKTSEERQFYLQQAAREQWSSRELERQLKTALFERTALSAPKTSQAVQQTHPAALEVFKDSYFVEFLGLPNSHGETDLQKGLIAQYQTQLPDRKLLQAKLHELFAQGQHGDEA